MQAKKKKKEKNRKKEKQNRENTLQLLGLARARKLVRSPSKKGRVGGWW
jgi:hypothetical protein